MPKHESQVYSKVDQVDLLVDLVVVEGFLVVVEGEEAETERESTTRLWMTGPGLNEPSVTGYIGLSMCMCHANQRLVTMERGKGKKRVRERERERDTMERKKQLSRITQCDLVRHWMCLEQEQKGWALALLHVPQTFNISNHWLIWFPRRRRRRQVHHTDTNPRSPKCCMVAA